MSDRFWPIAALHDRPNSAERGASIQGCFRPKKPFRNGRERTRRHRSSRTMQPCRIPPVQGFFELKANKKEGRTRLRYGLRDFIQIFHRRFPLWFGPFYSDGATQSDRKVDTLCILSIDRRVICYITAAQSKPRGKYSGQAITRYLYFPSPRILKGAFQR